VLGLFDWRVQRDFAVTLVQATIGIVAFKYTITEGTEIVCHCTIYLPRSDNDKDCDNSNMHYFYWICFM